MSMRGRTKKGSGLGWPEPWFDRGRRPGVRPCNRRRHLHPRGSCPERAAGDCAPGTATLNTGCGGSQPVSGAGLIAGAWRIAGAGPGPARIPVVLCPADALGPGATSSVTRRSAPVMSDVFSENGQRHLRNALILALFPSAQNQKKSYQHNHIDESDSVRMIDDERPDIYD